MSPELGRIPKHEISDMILRRYLGRAFLRDSQIPEKHTTLSISLCATIPGYIIGSFPLSVFLKCFVLFLELTLIIKFID
jgi:hypothetical protein